MSKKDEIYKRLIGTYNDCKGEQQHGQQIARILGVKHPYIYKIIRQLTKEGYIIPQGKKTCPMFYSATAKSPIRRDVTTTTPKDVTKSEHSSEFIQREKDFLFNGRDYAQQEIMLQKARYEILIGREYVDFFADKKSWMHGNCAHWKYRTKVFDFMGVWQFEKVGKNKLVVVMPEMIFQKDDLPQAKNTMFVIVYEALKWFAHEAKIKFVWDSLHMCQKPHVCRPARDSKAIRVARDWSLSIDGKMLDCSSGHADWETVILDRGVVDAVDALETWDVVAGVRNDFEDFSNRLSSLEDVQPQINRKMSILIKEMKELQELINPDVQPMDMDDPAFM